MTAIAEGSAPVQRLLVEDSPGNARLTLDAFRNANTSVQLHVATNGIEAMEFLRHEGKHRDARRPDRILLDLNLPKMDGRKVLELFTEDATLKTIRTVVPITSEVDADIVKSYQLHANGHLTKPWRSTGSRSW